MERFNPSSSEAKRATQAWQILVGCAHNRQTLTYLLLSIKMFGHPAPGVLGSTLGRIAAYCDQNELPQLNVLVVNLTGMPGESIPLNAADIDATRERVYDTDWYDIVPPTEADL
jgi:hypothetical protein